jgi:hypothetical protein
MPATAHFASARAELTVIESSSSPIFEGGRQVGTKPGRYHHFSDHRCKIEGQKSIDFMRSRMKAPDGPDIWEIDASDVQPAEALLAELATAHVARVREILQAEIEGPARTVVIATAQAVLEHAGVAERNPGGQKLVKA